MVATLNADSPQQEAMSFVGDDRFTRRSLPVLVWTSTRPRMGRYRLTLGLTPALP